MVLRYRFLGCWTPLAIALLACTHATPDQDHWKVVAGNSYAIVLYDSVRVKKLDTVRTYSVWERWIDREPLPGNGNRIEWDRGVRSGVALVDLQCDNWAMRLHQAFYYDSTGHAIDQTTYPNASWRTMPLGSVGEANIKTICAELETRSGSQRSPSKGQGFVLHNR